MAKRVDSNELFKELITKQLKNVPQNKKLQYTDLKRVCKYINSSIFDENQCSLWNGYITNANNTCKGTYVNFYFRKNKAALHRLLYANFVGELEKDEYLKFSCENKGKCCNITHLKKFTYQKKEDQEKKKIKREEQKAEKNESSVKMMLKNAVTKEERKNLLLVSFD